MAERVEIPGHVADEVVDGEAVLLNLQTGVYFGLNATGTRAWAILKRTTDPTQLLSELQLSYRLPPASLQADLSQWLDQLEECGLIRRTPESNVATA